MSGPLQAYFTHYVPNNHIELFKQIFELGANATRQDVLQFMLNAPVDQILQKAPVLNLVRSVGESFFAAVIEGLL